MRELNIRKLYYSISEVSKITEVEQYVLRYWEGEFEQLKPQKNRSGNRAYTNKDVSLVMRIKELLREKKYTIEGAKKMLLEKEEVIEVQTPEIQEEPIINETLISHSESLEPEIEGEVLIKRSDLAELVKLLKQLHQVL